MVGHAQVVQAYADGFDALTPKEKTFTYYLYLSAIAARDIAIDQHHPDALEVRDLMETMYTHRAAMDTAVASAVAKYTKLFWINNGFYDNLTSAKFVLECPYEAFAAAAHAVEQGGVTLAGEGGTLDQKLSRLKPVLSDPAVDPVLTNKTPGMDWVKGSAVNFYGKGLTYAEVDAWAKRGGEKHPLNSTVVKDHGTIQELVWRAGGEGVPAGRYAHQLGASIGYLEKAIPYAASEHQATVLRDLIRYYRTGDPDDFRKFNIDWVKDSSTVDFIHGFIEVYLDPRGQKGEFEASIFYTDPEQTKLMQNLAKFAQYFEDTAPWRDEFKKKIERSPIANVINVVVETGGTGPVSPIGINLPNEQAIRERYGSKSVLLNNITVAHDRSNGLEMLKEFAWDDEEVRNQELYGTKANNLHTAMHEVIGHGSGKVSPKLQGKDPSGFLPGYYNTLEEARADLVSLWGCMDARKLVEMGIAQDTVEARKIAETLYQRSLRTALNQLRRIGKSDQLEEDHLKNRQLIGMYILQNGSGAEVAHRDGKTYYRITDFDAVRKTVGELLAEVMRIKAEGDLPAAKSLIDTYGLKVDTALRDEVQQRVKHLQLPAYTGFVMPKLEPVKDASGTIVDITVSYPLDLATQMLGYSAFTRPMRSSANSAVAQ